jgi:hypothetical protein
VRPDTARLLVLELVAAFPFPQIPEATTRLYVASLLDLDEAIAAEVVTSIIRTETRWPPLGLLLGSYRRLAMWRADEFATTHGLPAPERPPIPDEVYAWLDRQRVIVAGRQADREADADREARRALLVWQDTTPVDALPVLPQAPEVVPRRRRWRRGRRA